MEESLSVLKTGKMGRAKAAKAKPELDKEVAAPKVKKGASEGATPRRRRAQGQGCGAEGQEGGGAAKKK